MEVGMGPRKFLIITGIIEQLLLFPAFLFAAFDFPFLFRYGPPFYVCGIPVLKKEVENELSGNPEGIYTSSCAEFG